MGELPRAAPPSVGYGITRSVPRRAGYVHRTAGGGGGGGGGPRGGGGGWGGGGGRCQGGGGPRPPDPSRVTVRSCAVSGYRYAVKTTKNRY